MEFSQSHQQFSTVTWDLEIPFFFPLQEAFLSDIVSKCRRSLHSLSTRATLTRAFGGVLITQV